MQRPLEKTLRRSAAPGKAQSPAAAEREPSKMAAPGCCCAPSSARGSSHEAARAPPRRRASTRGRSEGRGDGLLPWQLCRPSATSHLCVAKGLPRGGPQQKVANQAFAFRTDGLSNQRVRLIAVSARFPCAAGQAGRPTVTLTNQHRCCEQYSACLFFGSRFLCSSSGGTNQLS